ncbi:MAG: hypothetical protein M3P96_04825 [Actinomycetota bacterium]|nr:hypothetical protein [Actinomycetota bacterium]
MTSARHRQISQLERQLHPLDDAVIDELAVELMHHLTSVAVAAETALNRGNHAEALPHLLWMQQTLDSFGPDRQSLPDGEDAGLFLAQFHPDDARHDALAAEFRAALDAHARPTSDTKD